MGSLFVLYGLFGAGLGRMGSGLRPSLHLFS
jgi:hypothetical protein